MNSAYCPHHLLNPNPFLCLKSRHLQNQLLRLQNRDFLCSQKFDNVRKGATSLVAFAQFVAIGGASVLATSFNFKRKKAVEMRQSQVSYLTVVIQNM